MVTDRECDEVPAPTFGRVRLTGRLFGDRAIYSCEEGTGTKLVGLSERVCQADGQWAGGAPVCNRDSEYMIACSFVAYLLE